MLTGRLVRLVVGVVLVCALVGAAFAACASTDRGAVPAALVGRWKGGAHINGPWVYEFSADGGYRTWPEGSPSTMNTGTVVVAGGDSPSPGSGDITFSNGGAPITATWSLSNGLLVLDGQTYVHA
ncbi:MAG: hypothetical protein QOK35_1185 [Pseudonocardiales bacterium]|nr:hypothetical protein [Pseudonocardiales bacterium]